MGRAKRSLPKPATKGQPGGIGHGLRVVDEVVDELSVGLVGFGGSGGVDVECHGWAGVAEASRDGADVCAVRDEMCGRSMAQVMVMPTSA